jgi:integrase/recombinase XerD
MGGLRAVRVGDGGVELVDDWVLWMQARGMAKRTIKDRVDLVGRVCKASDVSPDVLTSREIMTYLARAEIGQSTRANYHVALSAWFRWLIEQGHRADNPMIRIPRPKIPRRRPRPSKSDHLVALLGSRMHRRTRTMILLAMYQGLRVHEIAKIRGDHLDLLGGRLYVNGKGGVDEWLPLHPRIELEAHGYPVKGYWFPAYDCDPQRPRPVKAKSVSRVIAEAMKRAGIPGSAHNLRHWFGTQLVRNGVDLRTAQTLLRHASLANTQIYTEIDEDQRTAGIGLLPDVDGP